MEGGDIGKRQSSAPMAAWIAAGVAVLAACATVYVVSLLNSKPAAAGYARFANGALEKLAVLEQAPPQPAERFIGADGQSAALADFRGRVILVNFWATWCAPCLEEMPDLAALERAKGSDDFAVVPISIDVATKEAEARAMLARLAGETLPFFIEPTRRIPISAQAAGVPTTILYDRDGRELARLAGAADWASPEAAALIDAALRD